MTRTERTRAPLRPGLEILDPRRLPAAGPTAALTGGLLVITGTDASEAIDVRTDEAGSLQVEGVGSFPASAVRAVLIKAGGGDDQVTVRLQGLRPPLVRVDAGLGDDTVRVEVDPSGWTPPAVILDGGPGADRFEADPTALRLRARRGTLDPSTTDLAPVPAPIAATMALAPPTVLPPAPSALPADSAYAGWAPVIVDLTNQARARAGLPTLEVTPNLEWAAAQQASQMAGAGVLSHDLPGATYPTLSTRLRAAGEAMGGAENIAFNYAAPEDVFAGWMASQGHRDNILDPAARRIGVAVAADALGRPYVAEVMGFDRG